MRYLVHLHSLFPDLFEPGHRSFSEWMQLLETQRLLQRREGRHLQNRAPLLEIEIQLSRPKAHDRQVQKERLDLLVSELKALPELSKEALESLLKEQRPQELDALSVVLADACALYSGEREDFFKLSHTGRVSYMKARLRQSVTHFGQTLTSEAAIERYETLVTQERLMLKTALETLIGAPVNRWTIERVQALAESMRKPESAPGRVLKDRLGARIRNETFKRLGNLVRREIGRLELILDPASPLWEPGQKLIWAEQTAGLALASGEAGKDCSTMRAAGFFHCPDERVFFAYLEGDPTPKAYLELTEGTSHGERAWLINTLNGDLKTGLVAPTYKAFMDVAHQQGVKRVLFLPESTVGRWYNSQSLVHAQTEAVQNPKLRPFRIQSPLTRKRLRPYVETSEFHNEFSLHSGWEPESIELNAPIGVSFRIRARPKSNALQAPTEQQVLRTAFSLFSSAADFDLSFFEENPKVAQESLRLFRNDDGLPTARWEATLQSLLGTDFPGKRAQITQRLVRAYLNASDWDSPENFKLNVERVLQWFSAPGQTSLEELLNAQGRLKGRIQAILATPEARARFERAAQAYVSPSASTDDTGRIRFLEHYLRWEDASGALTRALLADALKGFGKSEALTLAFDSAETTGAHDALVLTHEAVPSFQIELDQGLETLQKVSQAAASRLESAPNQSVLQEEALEFHLDFLKHLTSLGESHPSEELQKLLTRTMIELNLRQLDWMKTFKNTRRPVIERHAALTPITIYLNWVYPSSSSAQESIRALLSTPEGLQFRSDAQARLLFASRSQEGLSAADTQLLLDWCPLFDSFASSFGKEEAKTLSLALAHAMSNGSAGDLDSAFELFVSGKLPTTPKTVQLLERSFSSTSFRNQAWLMWIRANLDKEGKAELIRTFQTPELLYSLLGEELVNTLHARLPASLPLLSDPDVRSAIAHALYKSPIWNERTLTLLSTLALALTDANPLFPFFLERMKHLSVRIKDGNATRWMRLAKGPKKQPLEPVLNADQSIGKQMIFAIRKLIPSLQPPSPCSDALTQENTDTSPDT